MTPRDIIRMAREAGAGNFYLEKQSKKEDAYIVSKQFLERFACLVAADEREACAELCDSLPWVNGGCIPSNTAFASAIRAMGKA